jgi:hypothetical protein
MKATQAFVIQFNKDVKAIGKAESSVKELLSIYSRDLLEALHKDTNEAGELISDIRLVNELIEVLKTTNRKVAILFFKEFTGFRFDEALNKFTAKDKANYAKKQEAAIAFLEDVHNNIWSWADRNIEIEAKPLDLSKVAGLTIEEVADALGFAING